MDVDWQAYLDRWLAPFFRGVTAQDEGADGLRRHPRDRVGVCSDCDLGAESFQANLFRRRDPMPAIDKNESPIGLGEGNRGEQCASTHGVGIPSNLLLYIVDTRHSGQRRLTEVQTVFTTNHDADAPAAHTTILAYLAEHDPNILRFMANPPDLMAQKAQGWIEAREREFGIAATFSTKGERVYHKAFIAWAVCPARE
jgi:hypothetical protein